MSQPKPLRFPATNSLQSMTSQNEDGKIVVDIVAQDLTNMVDNAAQWDKKAECYSSGAYTLKSADPFALEAATITTGPRAGLAVMVFVPVRRQTFPFMELPAEVRNMVYKEVLVRGGYELAIDSSKKSHSISARPDRQSSGHPCYVDTKDAPLGITVSVLLICREAYKEGSPVLYGGNKFSFASTKVLASFIKRISKNTRHFKYIRIINTSILTSAQALLPITQAVRKISACKGLASLIFGTGASGISSRKMQDAESMAMLFEPVYRMIFDRSQSFDKVFSVIRVARSETPCPIHPGHITEHEKYSGRQFECEHCEYNDDYARYLARLKSAVIEIIENT